MEYRKIRADEFQSAIRIQAQAFHYQNFKDEVNDTGDKHRYVYAAMDGEFMAASLVASPHSVNYYGQYVPMTAVGGVACLPEYRRGGHMRNLLTYTLQDAKNRGDKLAGLYPFSHEFYRKFGFEQSCRVQHLVIPMEKLKTFPTVGKAVQFFPGMDETPFDRIWRAYTQNCNLACDRVGKWKHLLEKSPYADRQYVYLWQDDTGEPQGYVIYTPDSYQDGPAYRIQDIAYTSPQALRGILGFMKVLSPQGYHLIWRAPMTVEPFTLFPEPYGIQRQIYLHGMARLMDIPWCLENRFWPREQGTLTVRVTNDVIEDNNGVYRVTLGEKVTCEKTQDDDCDMTASIQALSLMCLGALDVDTLLLCREDLVIHRQYDLIKRCFPTCWVQMTEAF